MTGTCPLGICRPAVGGTLDAEASVAPRRFIRECQRSDLNCSPWSEVIVVGTPKHEIQPVRRAEMQGSAVVSTIGIVAGKLVYGSIHLNR